MFFVVAWALGRSLSGDVRSTPGRQSLLRPCRRRTSDTSLGPSRSSGFTQAQAQDGPADSSASFGSSRQDSARGSCSFH